LRVIGGDDAKKKAYDERYEKLNDDLQVLVK